MQRFLQVYRTTLTIDLDDKSPAEVMFNRTVRTTSGLLPPTKFSSKSSTKFYRQNAAFNTKHGAVPRDFVPGDAVFAQVHRGNSWQWQPASVVEKIGKVNCNVLLEDQRRLICAHANQLKRRVVEKSPLPVATPLSVCF